jgi:hypothetical protein
MKNKNLREKVESIRDRLDGRTRQLQQHMKEYHAEGKCVEFEVSNVKFNSLLMVLNDLNEALNE